MFDDDEGDPPMTPVTAADLRELLTSRASDPLLVEWLDEDAAVDDPIEVVSAALFDNITYSGRDRAHRVLASAENLRLTGDWDIANPTDEDCEAFAQMINEEWGDWGREVVEDNLRAEAARERLAAGWSDESDDPDSLEYRG